MSPSPGWRGSREAENRAARDGATYSPRGSFISPPSRRGRPTVAAEFSDSLGTPCEPGDDTSSRLFLLIHALQLTLSMDVTLWARTALKALRGRGVTKWNGVGSWGFCWSFESIAGRAELAVLARESFHRAMWAMFRSAVMRYRTWVGYVRSSGDRPYRCPSGVASGANARIRGLAEPGTLP